MRKLLSFIGKSLTIVAHWMSHISLRGLVVILGVALALSLPITQWLRPVDNFFLAASSYLFPSPSRSADIAIVEIPREELTIWQSDIHSSGKLAALLSNILNSSSSTVGVLLQQPIDTGSGAADVLIEAYAKGAAAVDDHNAKALVDRKYILMDLLNNERLVLGVERFVFAGQKPLLLNKPLMEHWPSALKPLLWPRCNTCFSEGEGIFVARPKLIQRTSVPPHYPFYQAAFLAEDGTAYTDFLTHMLAAMADLPRDTNVVWGPNDRLRVGDYVLPLAPNGWFIPLHGLTPRMAPIIDTIPLNEALARSAFPKIMLIARAGDPAALYTATALYSAKHGAALYTPWWGALALIVLVLIITVYLAFILTRIGITRAVAGSFTLGLVIILTQQLLVVGRHIWLPIAMPLMWLLVGHFLLLVWMIKKQRVQRLVARADDICIAQARQFMEQKDLADAYQQLRDCSVREPLLQTLYDLSEAYTEEKDYQQAVAVLESIKTKRKSFRDTEQKLEVLSSMMRTIQEEDSREALQKTMVIDAVATERTLGRYKLEREIGRGAMGQVYLGFDPRISRRVAIKTLKYDAFQGKEKEDTKARFYREAEAAGRLSHPSIVSVYDVGEEGDMAYIAMDYVEGRALNHFVNPQNLLPVFEVYRIICDVAVALEYAHENHIVHRDVKPGNIIYNPSPYQVKVTDFGIARLVDDSKTSTGEILGSPLYMAPEQLKGKKVNRAADIFSLGVTFYQLLTGHLPYEGDNLAALTYEIIHGKHKPARAVRKDLPASASRITNQALQKDPEDRYETAAEMAMVLKKAIRRDFASEAKKAGLI